MQTAENSRIASANSVDNRNSSANSATAMHLQCLYISRHSCARIRITNTHNHAKMRTNAQNCTKVCKMCRQVMCCVCSVSSEMELSIVSLFSSAIPVRPSSLPSSAIFSHYCIISAAAASAVHFCCVRCCICIYCCICCCCIRCCCCI